MYGFAPATTVRVARMLASITGDSAWYEESTKRLISAGAGESEVVSLYVELLRMRATGRGELNPPRAAPEHSESSRTPRRALGLRVSSKRFLRGRKRSEHRRRNQAALPRRAGPAPRSKSSRHSNRMPNADEGSLSSRRRERSGTATSPRRDPSFAPLWIAIGRTSWSQRSSPTSIDKQTNRRQPRLSPPPRPLPYGIVGGDPELAAALHIEAAFGRWIGGDPQRCDGRNSENAVSGAPGTPRSLVLGWAARGIDVNSPDARRRSIERAVQGGLADSRVLALERFAIEVGGGDPDDAAVALATIDRTADGAVDVAGALARLVWSGGAADTEAIEVAVSRIARRGPQALLLAAAEQTRIAREVGDVEGQARGARRWFDAGGGGAAAVEWLAAANSLGHADEERQARMAVSTILSGHAREAMLASAALLEARTAPDQPASLVLGDSPAVRLANLELSPPGSDPRRRASVLADLGGALGDEASLDAIALGGWSALVASDIESARLFFEKAATSRPADLASWEGLRTCGELSAKQGIARARGRRAWRALRGRSTRRVLLGGSRSPLAGTRRRRKWRARSRGELFARPETKRGVRQAFPACP